MKIHKSLKNILSFNFFLVAVLPLLAVGLRTLKFLTVSLTTEIQGQNFSIAKAVSPPSHLSSSGRNVAGGNYHFYGKTQN